MTLFTKLFQEQCPICKEVLTTHKSNVWISHVIKSCPNDHYEKEFIPALEAFIEHYDADLS